MSIYRIIGFILPIPFFVVINGGGISLPQSFYKIEGIGLPCCVIALFLFKDYFRYNRSLFILFLFFLIYFFSGILEGNQRHLISLQFMYFFVITRVFLSLGQSNLQQVTSAFNLGLLFFITMHLISIFTYSKSSYFTGTTEFFNFKIYQSLVTYPLVLCFGCALVLRQNSFPRYLKAYILIACGIIILFTLRRTSLAIYCFVLLIYLPFYLKFFGIILSTFIISYNIQRIDISDFERLFNFIESDLPRQNTWLNSLELLNRPDVVFLGNGENNYSHNFYLALTTSHGMFLGSMLIIVTLSYIGLLLQKHNDFYKSACFVFGYIFIDFFLNVNITQFYFSTIFALFLCYQSGDKRLNNEK